MKYIIIFFLLIWSFISVSQEKKGIISDSDGYTNMRDSSSAKSKIISKVIDGEVFNYWETNDSWFIVKTYNDTVGYIHRSRIKEFLAQSYNPYPNLDEIFAYYKNQGIVSVCGISASEIKGGKYYSGLWVFSSRTKEKLLEFSEGRYQTFEFKNGDIIVKEYMHLPVNKDFEVELVPYVINKVIYAGEKLLVIENAPFYNYPKLSDSEIKQNLNYLRTHKFDFEESYSAIKVALLCALNESEEGEKILLNISKEIDIQLDGYYQEDYHRALEVYQINKNNR